MAKPLKKKKQTNISMPPPAIVKSQTFHIVIRKGRVDGPNKVEELKKEKSVNLMSRTPRKRQLRTHHAPSILTDTLDFFSIEEIEPPLHVLGLPPLLRFHINILPIPTLDVFQRPTLQPMR